MMTRPPTRDWRNRLCQCRDCREQRQRRKQAVEDIFGGFNRRKTRPPDRAAALGELLRRRARSLERMGDAQRSRRIRDAARRGLAGPAPTPGWSPSH